MEKTLRSLFDFQRFEGNSRLAEMIAETESRYTGNELSDNDLSFVAAAGEINLRKDFE